MEFIKYEIKRGDTLESIALEYSLNVTELTNFHNLYCGTTNFIIGDKLPIHLDTIYVEQKIFEEAIIKSGNIESLNFENATRYRCEQLNISRINNEIITLSANTIYEFLVKKAKDTSIFDVELTDSDFSVEPAVYEPGLKFAQKLDKLKLPITFNISDNGVVKEIFNHNEIEHRWRNFRDNELQNAEIYQQLNAQSPKQAEDIIITGNKEFLDQNNLSNMMDKNLFFHLFTKSFLGDQLKNYQLQQFSQIFPNVDLKTDAVRSIVRENENLATYRLVGTLNRENLSDEMLKNMYDSIYKSSLKFNYTAFDFIYRINYTIDKETGLLQEGKASIAEKIKNNFEVITEYNIKKVEL
ncbi:LysM peptidoglycan-binding domain-containing protein [Chryseobacterium sp. Ch-15]|uniref:LysM peptidoglycan-binding domain-containing protein n=1 Tax=Chryseobacterium muglaense TaxID=2893752 RepID=A0A9Q3YTC9_9FLAO|nr:LysM peptidoglycan-binding domain-containing protein [Chryseobacterium muglaense]MBD3907179.1 LysM peptidoglycan-binding domain-containing protein [Chryseobacterium muglaense]MCC9036368.1 LysM peptidoglycan-binding domain-containing protein [Chryseobacterium muglaense]MCM2556463.1 LysM peptidoglycan-binding domain-containing protein [Chryseobacterium muglaense]